MTSKKEDRLYLLFLRGALAERQKHFEPAEDLFRQARAIWKTESASGFPSPAVVLGREGSWSAAASRSKRQVRRGRQSRMTSTPDAMLATEATISTSSNPT